MAVVSANGIAGPFEEDGEPYGSFGVRTPALRSFRLTFGSDRNVGLIGVLAGGAFNDLSPSAQQPPVSFPDGELHVYLQDAHPSGEEFAYDVAHSAIRIPGAHRYQIRDVGCVGVCTRQLPFAILGGINAISRPVLALVGFRLYFTGGRDHNLDRVGIWFTDGKLKVAFNDKNDDDVFGYVVDFVTIPTVGLNVSAKELKGQGATGFQTVPLATPSQTTFMLTGFDLNYQVGDHDVRDIGVYRRNHDLTVIHSDGKGTAPFDWRVSFVHLGPQVLAGSDVRANLTEIPLVADSDGS